MRSGACARQAAVEWEKAEIGKGTSRISRQETRTCSDGRRRQVTHLRRFKPFLGDVTTERLVEFLVVENLHLRIALEPVRDGAA